jgi:DNA-binding NarL/FixJ family response regulator
MIRVSIKASSPAARQRFETLLQQTDVETVDGPAEADVLLVEGDALSESLEDNETAPVVVWVRGGSEAMNSFAAVLDTVTPLLRGKMPANGNDDTLAEALTPREQEVLSLVAAGLSNKEMAARLDISEHTVKFHVASILGKLGAGSRTEAVTLGIRRGLVMI